MSTGARSFDCEPTSLEFVLLLISCGNYYMHYYIHDSYYVSGRELPHNRWWLLVSFGIRCRITVHLCVSLICSLPGCSGLLSVLFRFISTLHFYRPIIIYIKQASNKKNNTIYCAFLCISRVFLILITVLNKTWRLMKCCHLILRGVR